MLKMFVYVFFAGIVVLRFINISITPHAVNNLNDNGVRSNNNKSLNFSLLLRPDKIVDRTVAPYATASYGFIDLHGSLSLK